jgi:hypothetical protein
MKFTSVHERTFYDGSPVLECEDKPFHPGTVPTEYVVYTSSETTNNAMDEILVIGMF